jgi:fatty-acyl-CoA synthase
MLTIGETLSRAALAFPDKEAIGFVNNVERRITYAELNDEVNRFAGGLIKLGIRRGEKVAVWMQNNPEWVVAQFAVARIGAILVPMDTWYKASEAEYILKHSNSAAVVTSTGFGSINFLKVLKSIRSNLPLLDHIIVLDDEVCAMGDGNETPITRPGDRTDIPGFRSYCSVIDMGADWRHNNEYRDRRFQNDLQDGVMIIYTSGTTGKPKGAMLSHMNVVANVKDMASIMHITHQDRFLFPVPFSHIFGCVLGIGLTVVHGASMVVMEAFDPEDVLKTIDQEKVTVCHGVPTMFIRELEVLRDKAYDMSTLRTGIMAGAPCPVDTMEGVMSIMGCNICIAYGLTEGCVITLTRFQDSVEQRVTTVGRPLPNVEVKIVDEERHPVAPGEAGELACRGYNVMKGYYEMPEQTAETIDEDGWLYTGDLAVMNEKGYCSIVGRKKDMVIVGGFNVYPREIEEYLIANPKIQQVAVVGVPDHDLGEVVAAVIVTESGIEMTGQEVVDLCYGRMASAKVPRFVFFDKELPISSRGKVQKFLLRNELAKRIENEGIERYIPSGVKFAKKKEATEDIAQRMISFGAFEQEQVGELVEFIESLDQEQRVPFMKLILKDNL